MRDQIRSSYDTGGVRDSSEPWKPTSLRALFERKTFPRSADLATQMSYIQGAKTLIDTGSLMNSIDFDIAGTDTHLVASIGAGLSYIQTHEEGGEIEGHTVPERKSQFITEPEAQHLERLLEDEFERDS
jgi:phage gpG-like protein